jgi:hypothetical protein
MAGDGNADSGRWNYSSTPGQALENIPRRYPVCTWGLCHHVHSQREKQEYCPSRDTYQCSIGTVYMLDLVQQPVAKYVRLQEQYGTENKFLPRKEGNL